MLPHVFPVGQTDDVEVLGEGNTVGDPGVSHREHPQHLALLVVLHNPTVTVTVDRIKKWSSNHRILDIILINTDTIAL